MYSTMCSGWGQTNLKKKLIIVNKFKIPYYFLIGQVVLRQQLLTAFSSLVGLRIMNPSGSCSSFVSFFVYCTCLISSRPAIAGKYFLRLYSLCGKTECCLITQLRTATTITEGPVSVTALIGTNAQFHCAGTGNYLVWVVDGLQADHANISSRGITAGTVTSSSDRVQSSLTVPATSENNGTTVRCAITSLFSTPAISNYSTLTVLPGELN